METDSDDAENQFVERAHLPLLEYFSTTMGTDFLQHFLSAVDSHPWKIWRTRQAFLRDTSFDWHWYRCFHQVPVLDQDQAIYHYVNYGRYLEYETNSSKTDHETIASAVDVTSVNIQMSACLSPPMKRKILFVAHELSLTGGSICLLDMFHELNARHHVHVLNLGPEKPCIRIREELPHNLYTIDRIESYDMIVINTIAANVLDWYRQQQSTKGIQGILWVHETDDLFYENGMLASLTFRLVICDSVAVKETFLRHLHDRGGAIEKTENTPMIKVLELANPPYMLHRQTDRGVLRAKFALDPRAFVFLNIGTINVNKNQLFLVKCIEAHLAFLDEPVQFVFVGDTNHNPCAEYIHHSKHRHRLLHFFRFLPPLSPRRAHEYFALADAYINCTLNEPFGRVLIESMEWRLPLIGYKGGSHVRLIQHEFNGWLYEDQAGLWSGIVGLLTDPEKARQYGMNGYRWYKKHLPSFAEYSRDFERLLLLEKFPRLRYRGAVVRERPELCLLESTYWVQDEHVYIWGGYRDHSTTASSVIWKVHLLTSQVRQVATIPDDCATTHVHLVNVNGQDILILSGQVGDGFGRAGDAFYHYHVPSNRFQRGGTTPFQLYDARHFLYQGTLYIFSGCQKDRTTPNLWTWKCKILDDNGDIIFDPVWHRLDTAIVGTCHSSLIKTELENVFYFLSGCGCHVCCARDIGLYSLDGRNYRVTIRTDGEMHVETISTQDILVSHTESASFMMEDCLVTIGGQRPFDYHYNGIQLYVNGVWVELCVDRRWSGYFTKGCIAFNHRGVLHVIGGQQKDDKGYYTSRFHSTHVTIPWTFQRNLRT